MADEAINPTEDQSPEPVERAPKQVNPTVVLVAVVGAGIIAIALLVWTQGVRASAMRREAFGKGVDGIAAALSIPVVETGSIRNENRVARLQSIVDSVQRNGGYDVVVVTDPTGNVLASTDTSLQGQTVKEMADAGPKTKETEKDGLVEAVTAITTIGGDKVGALRIRVRF